MRYVRRDETGKINGHYANEQTYAKEMLPDDHPEILAWQAERAADQAKPRRINRQVEALEARIAQLEQLLKARK